MATVNAFQLMLDVNGTWVLSLTITGTQPAAMASYTRRLVVVSPRKCRQYSDLSSSVAYLNEAFAPPSIAGKETANEPKHGRKERERDKKVVGREGQNSKNLLDYFETVTPNLLFKDTGPQRAEVPLVFLSLDPARFFVLLGFCQFDGPVLSDGRRFGGHKEGSRHRVHGRVSHFPDPGVAVLAIDAGCSQQQKYRRKENATPNYGSGIAKERHASCSGHSPNSNSSLSQIKCGPLQTFKLHSSTSSFATHPCMTLPRK